MFSVGKLGGSLSLPIRPSGINGGKLYRDSPRLSGLGHAKVNHRLSQEVGIQEISEATERELEARARAADRWIERLKPTRR